MFLVGSLSTGGAERFVANAVTHLDRSRFRPYLALYRDVYSYPIPDDVRIRILNKYKPWHNISALANLVHWIDEVRPDVLLSAWSVPNVFAAETLRWTRHRPIWIARIANNPIGRETGLYGIWARNSYRKADCYISVSTRLGEEFQRSYPFAKGKLQVIHNAFDPERLLDTDAEPVHLEPKNAVHLLAVGRLEAQKRYDVMLRALARARQQENVHLHVLGEGAEGQALKRLAAELGIECAVSWYGFQDDPYRYFKAADIFLLTSDYEGMSNALLEAQGLGLPAVVTDCPFGNAEIVRHEDTGFVAQMGDDEAIAENICRLAGDPTLRESQGRSAASHIRGNFSLESMITGIEELCMRMLGKFHA
jgi:glycosyltransferase involved in cell wall biosynthesis